MASLDSLIPLRFNRSLRYILTGANVIDTQTGQSQQINIAITGNLITDTGSQAIPGVASDYQIIDLSGKYLIPGVVDLHQHLCADASPDSERHLGIGDEWETAGKRATSNMRESLTAGITTVRDVGSFQGRTLVLKTADLSKSGPMPGIYACGPLITYPGGHGSALGIEVRNIKDVREAIRRNLDLGADLVKITSDPEDSEGTTASRPSFTEFELRAIVDEAHSFGLKVACHTFPSREGVRRAIVAGVDTVEHAVVFDNELVELALRHNTILVPTVVAAADEFTADDVQHYLGIEAERWRKISLTNYPVGKLRSNGTPTPKSIRLWAQRIRNNARIMAKSGVKIGIGTDAGCRGTNFKSAIREMLALIELGASPQQTLQWATVTGAEALGSSRIGRIAKGFESDMIVLARNPIDDPDTLKAPVAVIAKGQLVS